MVSIYEHGDLAGLRGAARFLSSERVPQFVVCSGGWLDSYVRPEHEKPIAIPVCGAPAHTNSLRNR